LPTPAIIRGADLLACLDIGVNALAPRANTFNAKAEGRFGKEVFAYLPRKDACRCPAGKMLTRRFETKEGDLTMFVYWCKACPTWPLKSQCTTAKLRRVRHWDMRAWSRP
jgi:hypothetical protein